MHKPPRDTALDALRGLAVLGMVLSGSLAFGHALPAWMFHAQVPPPLHKFVPTLPGITWVDLVFPMFLFSLGAALPLALAKLPPAAALRVGARRFGLLLCFAFFTQQMKPGAGVLDQLQALAAFALLGGALVAGPGWRRAACAGVGLLLWWMKPGVRSDIILLVLAHMALFGTALWVATRTQPLARWAVLAGLGAVLLGAQAPGSWPAALLAASPVPALFQVHFLKYLFIVVPGMVVGEWLRQPLDAQPRALAPGLLALTVMNLALLFNREALALNAGLSAAAVLALGLLPAGPTRRIALFGGALLLIGLALEPQQGGIKKDSATFAYFFVTAGLSAWLLLALRAAPGWLAGYLALHGRNPLLAYVAGALVVGPLLKLSGLHAAWSGLNENAAQGLLKGLLFTGAVSLLTWACTRRGWIWKS